MENKEPVEEKTQIQVTVIVAEELMKRKKLNDSYSDVIARLIKANVLMRKFLDDKKLGLLFDKQYKVE